MWRSRLLETQGSVLDTSFDACKPLIQEAVSYRARCNQMAPSLLSLFIGFSCAVLWSQTSGGSQTHRPDLAVPASTVTMALQTPARASRPMHLTRAGQQPMQPAGTFKSMQLLWGPAEVAAAPPTLHGRPRHGDLMKIRAEDDNNAKVTEQSRSAAMEGIDTDMLAKLAAAEAEAQKLREQLGQLREDKTNETKKPIYQDRRIDGEGYRETLWGVNKERDGWLKDAEGQGQSPLLDFVVGKGAPGETWDSKPKMSDEDQDTVNRRLAIGLGGSAIALGLSQIPLLEGGGSKPLFLYIAPLVKIQGLLVECQDLAENGLWEQLSAASKAILGPPNDAQTNLLAAAATLDGNEEVQARKLAFNVLEDLEVLDYKRYLEAFVPPSGNDAIEYAKLCKKAAVSASKNLDKFYTMFDSESIEAARSQVASQQEALNAQLQGATEIKSEPG